MRPQLLFKIFFLAIIVPALSYAENLESKTKTTRERTIEKSFDVSDNATIKINNKYGNIDIITWGKNTAEFDIVIRVTGNNDDKVEEKLSGIDVEFSSANNMVTAITKISKNKSNWWNWGSSSNVKLEINYVVRIPETNNVDINNDYGGITLDKLTGQAKLDCDYGKITTKELMADNNYINFDYSKGCYFEYIKSGKINADYSSFTVSKANDLDINADYTNSKVELVENIVYNCDYNALSIGKANNVNGNGDYLTLRLGDIFKNAEIKADYGSIKIDRMASNAGNVKIDADYAGITLGYDSDYNFNFSIDLDYGSLRNADNFNFTNKRIKSSSRFYQGSYGNSNSKNFITINSDYGNVNFKKK